MRTRISVVLSLILGLGGAGLAGCGASKAHLQKAEIDGRLLRVELAQTYVGRGAYEAAIPLLRLAVAEFPDSPRVRTLYGTVLRERGLYPQAEREFLAALRTAPGFAPAWAGLGILYDLMRRPADAERAHRRAIALAPGVAAYWNNLGFSLYVAGRTDEAIAALERALALDPSLVVAYNNLGFAYGRKGDYANAERCFRGAAGGSGEAGAYLNLALVYEQNGDVAAAERLRSAAEEVQ